MSMGDWDACDIEQRGTTGSALVGYASAEALVCETGIQIQHSQRGPAFLKVTPRVPTALHASRASQQIGPSCRE